LCQLVERTALAKLILMSQTSGSVTGGGQGAMAMAHTLARLFALKSTKHAILRLENPKFCTALDSPAFGPLSGPPTLK